MRRTYRSLLVLLPLVLLGWVRNADAAFHLIKVTEVFGGNAAEPDAQFIELRMYAGGQTEVGTHSVQLFNAANTMIASATFVAIGDAGDPDIPNGAAQATILIGTSEVTTYFGLTPDLIINMTIPLIGGKVCFDSIDCVAWGAFSGAGAVGTPFDATTGIPQGLSINRRFDIVAPNSSLEAGDDTNDSENDFTLGNPTPRNNAGTTGVPQPGCGNAIVDPTEDCDDGNSTNGDGCSTACDFEIVPDAGIDAPIDASTFDASSADAAFDASAADATPADATPGDATPAADAAASDAAAAPPDAAAPADAPAADPDAAEEQPPEEDGGCGCRAPASGGAGSALLLALVGLLVIRRKRA